MADVERLVKETIQHFGGLDVLIGNAVCTIATSMLLEMLATVCPYQASRFSVQSLSTSLGASLDDWYHNSPTDRKNRDGRASVQCQICTT